VADLAEKAESATAQTGQSRRRSNSNLSGGTSWEFLKSSYGWKPLGTAGVKSLRIQN
jgi:hypothetical protein